MKTTGKVISWGFVVSLLSLLWAVFTWWDSGAEAAPDWQDKQNRLLIDLIEETRKTRLYLEQLTQFDNGENEVVADAQQQRQQQQQAPATSPSGQSTRPPSRPPAAKSSEPAPTPEDTSSGDAGIEDKAIAADPAVGRQGWVFFGKLDRSGKAWDDGYTLVLGDKNASKITEQRIVEVAVSVGFNDSKPEFPRYEKGIKRIYPFTLEPGSKVRILEVFDDVGWRNFTWARVEIVHNVGFGGS